MAKESMGGPQAGPSPEPGGTAAGTTPEPGGTAAGRTREPPKGVAQLSAGEETPPELMCSIARSLCVLGERWTFLILREAFSGVTRFSDFRARLGVAPDVLTDRLATLTEAGVLTREPYQEAGRRARYAYQLTPAGWELRVVLGSLQQWGDEHFPPPGGPTVARRARETGRPLHVGYIDDQGHEVGLPDVEFIPTANYPARH